MSSSILASIYLVLKYGFCTNIDVSVLFPELFELRLPKTLISIFKITENTFSK